MVAEPTAAVVNRWVEPEWAKEYLERRESIPHRGEGYAAVLELLACGDPIARVLDLGTGDGYTLGRVLAAYPDAVGVGLDFSTEMLGRARAHFGDDPRVEIHEHDLDRPLPKRSDRSISSSRASRSTTACPSVSGRSTARCSNASLRAGGSSTWSTSRRRLLRCTKSSSPRSAPKKIPSNKLVAVDTQLGWLRDIGFADVDCFWKWRELALLSGRRPV